MSNIAVNNRRIAKNTLFLYFRLLLATLVGLYTSRIILAVLGNEDFGVHSVVSSIVVIFYFLNTTMAGATSRFLIFELGRQDYTRLQKVFSASLTIHLLIALVTVVLGETIGLWYLENKMVINANRMTAARWVYQLSLVSSIFTILQVPYSALIIAYEKMDAYAYIEITKTILQLVIVLLLSHVNFDKLIVYACLTTIVSLIIFFIYRTYCVFHYQESKYKFQKDFQIFKPILSFTGWNLYSGLARQAQGNGVNIILNLFFGSLINAGYSIGLQLSRAVFSFVSNFTLAVKPQIIKYYSSGEIKEMENLMNTTTRYTFLLLYTLALPVMIEITAILKIWLKNPPAHAAVFCQFFLILLLLEVLYLNLTYAIQATNRMKLPSIVGGTLFLMIPIISFIFFKLGLRLIYFPMIIAIFCYSLIVLSRLIIAKKLIPRLSLKKYCKNVLLYSAITVSIGSITPLLVHCFIAEGWIRLFLVCVSTVVSMILSSYFFATSKTTRIKIQSKITRMISNIQK